MGLAVPSFDDLGVRDTKHIYAIVLSMRASILQRILTNDIDKEEADKRMLKTLLHLFSQSCT